MAWFYSNASSGTARNLVEINNDNAAADAAVCLYLNQDGDDAHIEFAGAGGGGIKFAADIASSDSDTLDDYEEGTWTGEYSDLTTAIGMNGSYTTGYYTKVGNLVTVTGLFMANGLNGLSGESVSLTGLPFTIVNNTAAYPGGGFGYGAGLAITAGRAISYNGVINTTYLGLYQWSATTGSAPLTAAELSTDGYFIIGFSYRAA